MKLYPHWLDGESIRIWTVHTGMSQTPQLIRHLKLHALLGTEFILNDVQVFDSQVIVDLFGSVEDPIHSFLADNSDFLRMRAFPHPDFSSTAVGLALRGVHRALAPEWQSSLFPSDPRPLVALAGEIHEHAAAGEILDARKSKTVERHPHIARELSGVLRSLAYFAALDRTDEIATSVSAPATYLMVLEELSRRADTNPEIASAARTALQFVEAHVPPLARNARSAVRKALDARAWDADAHGIWQTVVQCWNYATERTVQAEGAAAAHLPLSASVATEFDSVIDLMVPFSAEEGGFVGLPAGFRRGKRSLLVNLDALKWADIGRARGNGRWRDSARRLSAARGTLDPALIETAVDEHIALLATLLTETPVPVSKALMYVVGGGLTIAIGCHFSEAVAALKTINVVPEAFGAERVIKGTALLQHRARQIMVKRNLISTLCHGAVHGIKERK